MKKLLTFRRTKVGVWCGLLLMLSAAIAEAQSSRIENDVMTRARPFERMIASAAAKHVIDPHWLYVVAYLETRFQPKAVSPRGARGMMQFMPATAARYGLRNPHHPQASLNAAAQYLRDLATRFAGRADLTLAAYNAGETTVEAYRQGRTIKAGGRLINPRGVITGGIPPYRETRLYVARGVRLLQALRAHSTVVTRTASPKEKPSFPPTKRLSIYFGKSPTQE